MLQTKRCRFLIITFSRLVYPKQFIWGYMGEMSGKYNLTFHTVLSNGTATLIDSRMPVSISLPQVTVDSFLSQKGRSLRSGRTILSSPSPTTSPESSDASEGVMYAWGESSTDSGDVSDWTAEVTSVPLGRKRTRRQRSVIL